MNDYINDFTNHLTEAMEIGASSEFVNTDKKFKNILICGLGGSGIGGTILNDIVSLDIDIPISSTKDYRSQFCNENTLVILLPYSETQRNYFMQNLRKKRNLYYNLWRKIKGHSD